MTQEQRDQMQKEIHDWLFDEIISGQPSRAAQIDQILSTTRAGKIGFSLFLRFCGAVIAVAGAWAAIKSIGIGWFSE